MSERELQWIARSAETNYPIVEVGCYHGRSTRAWTDNCPGQVYAVDPWKGTYYTDKGRALLEIGECVYSSFYSNVKDCKNLIVFRGELPQFVESKIMGEQAGLVFIDGDHREEQVRIDIDAAMKILRPGGIIAGHDYTHTDWPGVKRVVDELFPTAMKWESIWWIQKS